MGLLTTPPAPTWPSVLAQWSIEAPVVALLVAAGMAYALGRRALAARAVAGAGQAATDPAAVDPCRVEQAGGDRRAVLFGSGLGVVAIALLSPLSTYAHALLSAHMVQHLLLALVAAPLLLAAHPAPILLAALSGGASERFRALARSRVARLATHPLVTWLTFAATGWVVHFSPLFDAALLHPLLHAAEHGLFLGSGLLFWHPVLAEASEVGPGTLSYPLRLLYVALAMPQNTFLALAILSADHPLYDAYVRLARTWGPSVMDDQRQAAGLMWVAGDLTLLVAVLAVALAWANHDRDSEDSDDFDDSEDGSDPAADPAADLSGG